MDEQNEIHISKHSSGVSIIIRLDLLWKDSHRHMRDGQYNKWNEDLDCIWLELARDLKEDKVDENKDYTKLTDKFKEFEGKITAEGQINDKEPAGFEVLKKEDIERRNKHYKILMDKQLFLARLENKVGKGTTFDDEDDDWD